MTRNQMLATALFVAISSSALAQSNQPAVPSAQGVKLSEIIGKVEQRDQFQYVSDVDWDEDGFYTVTYFTTDKARVEIKIDPATGSPM